MKYSSFVKNIFDDICHHGGQVYFVGGCVRDDILGYETHDYDVEVYHLNYHQLHDLLSKYGHVNTFGKSFAIMQLDTLPHYDFALPRREYKIGEKHQDFEVDIDPDLPLDKAILRRDLTMNALMYDYQKDCIIDLCRGLDDIKHRIIRVVDENTFIEDPLRVLRVAQFASRFQMEIDEKTYQLCQQMVQEHMLDHLSIERIYQEYCKILMSPKPSIGFRFLSDINALPFYLEDLKKTHQRSDFHPEGSVFNHTLMVLDVAAKMKEKVDEPLSFMWSCLLHDIGKPIVTTVEGHAPLHNEAGVQLFEKVDLIQSKKQRQYIRTMIMYHMHLMNMSRHGSKDHRYLRLLKLIDKKVSLNDLIWMSYCDKVGRGRVVESQIDVFWDYIQDKKERLTDQAIEAIVDGNDLIQEGFTHHHQFKDILEEAYELQLQGMKKEKILRRLKKKYE